MIILGIDPGLINTGWAIIDFQTHNKISYVEGGVIITNNKQIIAQRLLTIYDDLNLLLKKFEIQQGSIEKTLINNNAHSSIDLAMAKSIILLIFAQKNIHYQEYAPTTIKKVITGNGKADKLQIGKMLEYYIKLPAEKKISHHESDAVAIALCCGFSEIKNR